MVPPRAKTYLVECYWPGVNGEKVAATERRLCARVSSLRSEGRDVAYLGSILVPADESLFCLFDGEEPDIRSATDLAGVPFGRVLESLRSGSVGGSTTGSGRDWEE
jgi:hypothetical protein